jgi:hypothetical protein
MHFYIRAVRENDINFYRNYLFLLQAGKNGIEYSGFYPAANSCINRVPISKSIHFCMCTVTCGNGISMPFSLNAL